MRSGGAGFRFSRFTDRLFQARISRQADDASSHGNAGRKGDGAPGGFQRRGVLDRDYAADSGIARAGDERVDGDPGRFGQSVAAAVAQLCGAGHQLLHDSRHVDASPRHHAQRSQDGCVAALHQRMLALAHRFRALPNVGAGDVPANSGSESGRGILRGNFRSGRRLLLALYPRRVP